MIEEYNQHHTGHGISGADDSGVHLPPIEPPTPSVGNARKILQKGDSLVTKAKTGKLLT